MFGDILNGLSNIATGFNYLFRGIQCAEAAADIHQTITDDSKDLSTTQKVSRVAANGAFMACQAGEIGAAIGGASNQNILALKMASGVTDCTKVVVRKRTSGQPLGRDDYLDVAATVAYRVADSGGFAAGNCPEVCLGQEQTIKQLAELVETGGTLVANRKLFAKVVTNVRHRIQTRNSSRVQPSPQNGPSNGNENDPLLQVGEDYMSDIMEVINAQDESSLDHVPAVFHNDRTLKMWTCRITEKPIRYVMVIQQTQQDDNPVYYERSAIEDWLRNTPNQSPPGWPDGVNLSRSCLTISRPDQRRIDCQLKILIQEFKEACRQQE